MSIQTESIPLSLCVVRIDNKKMTLSMLEQIPIYSLADHIGETQDATINVEDGSITWVCRISAVPVIKGLKAHLLKTLRHKEHVENRLYSYKDVREFGLWLIDNSPYLHPIGEEIRVPYDNDWYMILKKFNHTFMLCPRAIIGV